MNDKSKKFGLGRGLEALLGDEKFDLNDNLSDIDSLMKNTVFKSESKNELPLEKIERCSFQPRSEFNQEALRELSESIKEKGVLQPILVREKGDKYEIIAGERRFQAAKLAGLATIPAIVKQFNDGQVLEIALIENIQRENLSAIEEAKGLFRLIDEYRYKQEELGKLIGKSRSYIANTLRLLNLPNKVQRLILDGKLSAGHARTLIGLENAEELAETIVRKDLSVRDAEKLAAENKPVKIKIKYIETPDLNLKSIMDDLEEKLGLKVKINAGKKGGGSITLKYENPAQLSKLLDILEER